MKIAIIYDRIVKWGGAERVLSALHEVWSEAPFYCAIYDKAKTPWTKGWDIRPSFLNKLPLIRSNHEYFFWLMPKAFKRFDLSDFDVILSVTSAEAKGIQTNSNQLHISYTLTPTRYLWSHTSEYSQAKGKISCLRLLFFSLMRQWDFETAQKIDKLIPISEHVKKRIKKYYKINSEEKIYPPVHLDANAKELSEVEKQIVNNLPKEYYLVVSRLVPYKHVDIAIRAAQSLNKHLVIVGTGVEMANLKGFADKTVTFMGSVSDQLLVKLYQQAGLLLFPQEEDFGIVAVEAQLYGLPVVALRKGAAEETVLDGKTGVFFDNPRVESIIRAIHSLKDHTLYDKNDIRAWAQTFSKQRFQEEIREKVNALWNQHQATQ